MDAQLRLLAPRDTDEPAEVGHRPESWRLTTTTREIGRKGVAQARAALQQARRTGLADGQPSADTSRAA
jgi:hypothetical protein